MPKLILLNKPFGVVCQFSPSGDKSTLRDFVADRDVYPAGRLDADSEGLVLLTGDGVLQHRITDPRHKLAKTYLAQVEGVPGPDALDRIRRGIAIRDYTTLPALVRQVPEPAWLWPRTPPIRFRREIPTSWLEITLKEGRNRQVRHMTAAVGHPTLRLIRYAIGQWTLDGLSPGESATRPATALPPPAHAATACRQPVRHRGKPKAGKVRYPAE